MNSGLSKRVKIFFIGNRYQIELNRYSNSLYIFKRYIRKYLAEAVFDRLEEALL